MKSATGLTGSGSRDWFIQRVSAVVLAVYTVVVFGWILLNGGFNFEQWYGFMMTLPMKIMSILAVLSLLGFDLPQYTHTKSHRVLRMVVKNLGLFGQDAIRLKVDE